MTIMFLDKNNLPGLKKIVNSEHLRTKINITLIGIENIPQDIKGLMLNINRLVILIVIKIVIKRLKWGKLSQLICIKMNNLFSIFDPSTRFLLSINWISLVIFKIAFISIYFNSEIQLGFNRFNKLTLILVFSLHSEFKIPINEKVIPYSLGFFTWLFLFCSTINFLGLTPYTFTPSRRISLTLSIAVCVWFFMEIGFVLKAIKRFLAHLVPSGTPDMLIPLIVVIELVRNFIRPITLSVRLAANIVAGHLLISLVNGGRLTIITTPAILLSGVVLMILEVSVAFIQGYVFSTLRVIYFSELNSALVANKS